MHLYYVIWYIALPGPFGSDPFIWCLGIIVSPISPEGKAFLEVRLAEDYEWGSGDNAVTLEDGETMLGAV